MIKHLSDKDLGHSTGKMLTSADCLLSADLNKSKGNLDLVLEEEDNGYPEINCVSEDGCYSH